MQMSDQDEAALLVFGIQIGLCLCMTDYRMVANEILAAYLDGRMSAIAVQALTDKLDEQMRELIDLKNNSRMVMS
jgi:hypothetical protein